MITNTVPGRLRLLACIGSLAACLSTACGDEGSAGGAEDVDGGAAAGATGVAVDTTGGAGGEPVAPPPRVSTHPPCVFSADCPDGQHCDLGECVQDCNEESACETGSTCSARAPLPRSGRRRQGSGSRHRAHRYRYRRAALRATHGRRRYALGPPAERLGRAGALSRRAAGAPSCHRRSPGGIRARDDAHVQREHGGAARPQRARNDPHLHEPRQCRRRCADQGRAYRHLPGCALVRRLGTAAREHPGRRRHGRKQRRRHGAGRP